MALTRKAVVATGVLLALTALGPPTADSQNPPIDLTELDLEALLRVRIAPDQDPDETGRRWNVGYRFIELTSEGYQDGTVDLELDQVLGQFPVVPVKIRQQAHIVHVGFASSRRLNLILTLPLVEQRTDHIRRVGDPFAISSSGIGDVSFSTAYTFYWGENRQLRASAGLAVPTGSIDETGTTPRGPGTQLPYTMQLGSGTWDLLPGLAYGEQRKHVDWQFQIRGIVRLERNDRGYVLGDRLLMTGTVSPHFLPWLTPSVKLQIYSWQDIEGADPALDPSLAPIADPELYGGEKVSLVLGAEIRPPWKSWRGFAVVVEAGLPLYQSLNGPQPEEDGYLSAGWEYRF